jgi:hypothetical protein
MKRLLIVALATLALTGCAHRYVGPALVGGAVGYTIANSHRPVVVHPGPIVIQEPVIIVSAQCNQYINPSERSACERGARQRYHEEQRRRDNEAYRQGLGR